MKHAREDYNRIQDPDGLIPEMEPVFLIRGQDAAAPAAVRFWCHAARYQGASDEIILKAMAQADRMEEWHRSQNRKTPDL